MKNRLTTFLMFLSMILTVSCGKDYNALFQERITELNKEGKYILNQYNDSVGKEHYIVYIDADKIVVDTLGDSLQVYPLGKVETYQYLPNVDFNDGKFSLERYNSTDCSIKADTAKKQIMVSDDTFYPKGEIVKFSELKAYKRDYVLIPTTQQTLIAFLNKKMEVYTGSPADVQEDERGFMLSYVGQCRDYLSGMPGGLPADLVFEVCSYNARMDFIEKFKSSIELQQYIIKKVNYLIEVIKKEHRTIQWMKAVGEHNDWQIFTWYWSTLACEWQNDEEGKVYMDTMPDDKDSSKVIVKLGNRANNVEMLKRTLERIGHADKTSAIDTTDNCYVTIATIDSLEPNTEADANTVAGKLKELIKDITYKNIK